MTREQQILTFIVSYMAENTWAPTVREIGAGVGLASPATVTRYLHRLDRKGLIVMLPMSPRALRLTDKGKRVIACD